MATPSTSRLQAIESSLQDIEKWLDERDQLDKNYDLIVIHRAEIIVLLLVACELAVHVLLQGHALQESVQIAVPMLATVAYMLSIPKVVYPPLPPLRVASSAAGEEARPDDKTGPTPPAASPSPPTTSPQSTSPVVLTSPVNPSSPSSPPALDRSVASPDSQQQQVSPRTPQRKWSFRGTKKSKADETV